MSGKHLASPRPKVDAVVLSLLIATSLGSAWRIYQTTWFFLPLLVGIVAGLVIALLSITRGWPTWKTLAVTAGTYIVLGTPVAAPLSMFGGGSIGARIIQVIIAPVAAWKQVLSLELPLGAYEAVLAPVFLLALACSTAAFSFAWRPGVPWAAAAPVAALPLFYGIVFGPSFIDSRMLRFFEVGDSWLLGVAVLLIGFGWLAWRPAATRGVSVTAALGLLSGDLRRRLLGLKIFRFALGAVMVAIGLVVSSALTGTMMQGRHRDVLRETIDPVVQVAAQQSPLLTYRDFFSDENFSKELFSVQDYGEIERVRLATLSQYDGYLFTVVSPDGAGASSAEANRFIRLPYRVNPSVFGIDAAETQSARPTVDITGYEGVWMPIPGASIAFDFGGNRKASLRDHFYLNETTNTGINLVEGGLQQGDRYSTDAYPYVLPANAIAQFAPDSDGGQALKADVPESLKRWVASQQVSMDGVGLLELVSSLRSRGYLSHALMIDEQSTPAWIEELGDYTFVPSRAGHSLDRVDVMFEALLEQQDAVGVEASDEALVAAVGDDEQFATAAALVAGELGFTSRIVLGARLSQPEGEESLPTCDSGVCSGADMTVWLEVKDGETGRWAAVDVTPQHVASPMPSEQHRSDPKHNTDVPQDTVLALPPPQPKPVVGEVEPLEESQKNRESAEIGEVLRYAGITGLSLFIISAPALTILGAKWIRRQRRRKDPNPVQNALGAWDEYEDRCLDFGLLPARSSTRTEMATAFSGTDPNAARLASLSDHATFGVIDPAALDPDPAWQASVSATQQLRSRYTKQRRIVASLSPRSLIGTLRVSRNQKIHSEEQK